MSRFLDLLFNLCASTYYIKHNVDLNETFSPAF